MVAPLLMRTSPQVMARNMTSARAPRYAMYLVAAFIVLLIIALAANPSGWQRNGRMKQMDSTTFDRRLQSQSEPTKIDRSYNNNNNEQSTNGKNTNGNIDGDSSSTEELITREFKKLGSYARLCERINADITRYRRRQRVLDANINMNNIDNNDKNNSPISLPDRYHVLSTSCRNLKVQVGSLMDAIVTYRTEDISQLRNILNRVESLKTWGEEQFPMSALSSQHDNDDDTNDDNDVNHHRQIEGGITPSSVDVTSTNNVNVTTTTTPSPSLSSIGNHGIGSADHLFSSVDSQRWLDDAPDPDFRLPNIPDATPAEIAIAREAAARVAEAEARARATQAKEEANAAELAKTVAARAAGLATVNLTAEEELRWAECKRLALTFSIIPRKQWGTATAAVQSEYKRRKCDDVLSLRPVYVATPNATAAPPQRKQLTPHEVKLWGECAWVYGSYDMELGRSWGLANRDVQRAWKTMLCDPLMKIMVPPVWTDPLWNHHGITPTQPRIAANGQVQSIPSIAILIPTTTRGLNDIRSMKHLSLYTVILPSIRRTVESGYDYHVWIGYDHDDAYYTKPNATAEITGWCNAQMTWLSNHGRGIKIFVRMVPLTNNTYRKPGHAINELAMMAYNDPDTKYDYFYRLSDDIQLVDGWTKRFVTILTTQFGAPYYGVVGPQCDEGQLNRSTLTQDFVHRTHLDIFQPYYYPYILSDWWSDNWITRIYGRQRTSRVMGIRARHRLHSHGTRYQVDTTHESYLESEIVAGRHKVEAYMKRTGAPTDVIAKYVADDWNFSVSNG